ncbi:MAG: phage/plasmid primase, P4 family [Archaeoglobaceae archaeon]
MKSEFLKLIHRLNEANVDPILIPIKPQSKEPDVSVSIKENLDKVRLTPQEAIKRLEEGKNVGIYAFPHGLCFVDIESDFIDKIDFETFTVKTRDGGRHYYFLNPGIDRNHVLKSDGKKIGELRANWQYVLTPGSYVPSEKDDGYYKVVKDLPIAKLDFEALKRFIEEELKKEKTTTPQKTTSPQNQGSDFKNVFGISLKTILIADKKLRELLKTLEHPDYPSRSEADFATINRLWYWGFSENDIKEILRVYRPYEKTERDDYLIHTIEKAISSFSGERFDPSKNPQLFIELCSIENGLNKNKLNKIELNSDQVVSVVQEVHPFYSPESEEICHSIVKCKNKVVESLDHLDHPDQNDRVDDWMSDMIKKISDKMTNPKKFFRDDKALADHILQEKRFITLTDTEEVWYYDESEGVWKPNGEIIIKKLCEHYLGEDADIRRVNEVIGHIRRSTYVDRSIFDRNIELIAVENGVLNLRTGELLPFNPDYYLTVKLPVKFNPEADCPKIKQFFREIVHESDVPILFEIFGYCLWREYFIHKAFMFVGNGWNGKTTLLNLLERFLDKRNVSSVSLHDLEKNRFASSDLFCKLANIYDDLSPEALKDTGLFKRLTGRGIIRGEEKYKSKFYFKNYAKLVFTCNQLPESRDNSDAFFGRWIIINFPNQFIGDKRKPNLIEELTTEEELSGLLNNAILALWNLLQRGEFSDGKSVEEIRALYIRMSDPVSAFKEDCLIVDSKAKTPKSEVYQAFCDYCRENNLPVISHSAFAQKLRAVLGTRISDTRIRRGSDRIHAWIGIRLKPKILEKDGFFICSKCGEKFSTKESAEDHVELSIEYPEICEGETGSSSSEDEDKPSGKFVCVCGKKFDSETKLTKHQAKCVEFQREQNRQVREELEARGWL